jgi:glycosyltransferase involved in cell wall biosynthesis
MISEKKVCIIGCAKNVEKHLEKTFAKITEIYNQFHSDSVIIIAENDSIDNTKQIMNIYKSNSCKNVILLNYDGKLNKYSTRTSKLAYLRNELIKYIHKHYSTYDYIIIVDMDDVIHTLDINNLMGVFNIDSNWDAIFANSGINGKAMAYYDIWALRSPAMGIDYDCWDAINHLMATGMQYNIAVDKCVKTFQKEIDINRGLIPVKSAFGGLGIYKLQSTRACDYNGENNYCSCKHIKPKLNSCRNDVCEHVAFHIDMVRKGCKLFIYSQLLVNPPIEHIT